MKKLLFAVLLSGYAFADTYVDGYVRQDGTYVQGHYRSSPNNTTSDNYSTYGNTNPYTGKSGTKAYDSSEDSTDNSTSDYGNNY
jgi:hypothetical protein